MRCLRFVGVQSLESIKLRPHTPCRHLGYSGHDGSFAGIGRLRAELRKQCGRGGNVDIRVGTWSVCLGQLLKGSWRA